MDGKLSNIALFEGFAYFLFVDCFREVIISESELPLRVSEKDPRVCKYDLNDRY